MILKFSFKKYASFIPAFLLYGFCLKYYPVKIKPVTVRHLTKDRFVRFKGIPAFLELAVKRFWVTFIFQPAYMPQHSF